MTWAYNTERMELPIDFRLSAIATVVEEGEGRAGLEIRGQADSFWSIGMTIYNMVEADPCQDSPLDHELD
jgi:hypothetical protein